LNRLRIIKTRTPESKHRKPSFSILKPEFTVRIIVILGNGAGIAMAAGELSPGKAEPTLALL
jgi:hypothetical protein